MLLYLFPWFFFFLQLYEAGFLVLRKRTSTSISLGATSRKTCYSCPQRHLLHNGLTKILKEPIFLGQTIIPLYFFNFNAFDCFRCTSWCFFKIYLNPLHRHKILGSFMNKLEVLLKSVLIQGYGTVAHTDYGCPMKPFFIKIQET